MADQKDRAQDQMLASLGNRVTTLEKIVGALGEEVRVLRQTTAVEHRVTTLEQIAGELSKAVYELQRKTGILP